MPPKKHKTNVVSGFSSDYAAMSSNDIIGTDTDLHKDPFSNPNVITMAITKLKSELNRLNVCIVGNQAKTTSETDSKVILMGHEIVKLLCPALVYSKGFC
jgi:hypothetical protein